MRLMPSVSLQSRFKANVVITARALSARKAQAKKEKKKKLSNLSPFRLIASRESILNA